MSMGRKMDKEDVVYTHTNTEYYSAIIKNKIMHWQQHGWT